LRPYFGLRDYITDAQHLGTEDAISYRMYNATITTNYQATPISKEWTKFLMTAWQMFYQIIISFLSIIQTQNCLRKCQTAIIIRKRTIIGSIIGNVSEPIMGVSYRLLLYRRILCASQQVHQLLTDRITHDDQRAFMLDPSPARRARMRACCFMVHDTGEGSRGGRRKETVT